jgi:hypothetical protein
VSSTIRDLTAGSGHVSRTSAPTSSRVSTRTGNCSRSATDYERTRAMRLRSMCPGELGGRDTPAARRLRQWVGLVSFAYSRPSR